MTDDREPLGLHGVFNPLADKGRPLTPQQVADRVNAWMRADVPVHGDGRINVVARRHTMTKDHRVVVHPEVAEDIELGLGNYPRERWHSLIHERPAPAGQRGGYMDVYVGTLLLASDPSLRLDEVRVRLDAVLP